MLLNAEPLSSYEAKILWMAMSSYFLHSVQGGKLLNAEHLCYNEGLIVWPHSQTTFSKHCWFSWSVCVIEDLWIHSWASLKKKRNQHNIFVLSLDNADLCQSVSHLEPLTSLKFRVSLLLILMKVFSSSTTKKKLSSFIFQWFLWAFFSHCVSHPLFNSYI